MFPIVELVRLEESYEYGTFGVLVINKEVFCVTLEPADNLNQQQISSIPCQQYICERVVSPNFGNTFEVKNVPGRSNVLFHAGNFISNTKGCILLAQYFGKIKEKDVMKRAVVNSGNTFKSFMELMKGYDKFHLTIKECF